MFIKTCWPSDAGGTSGRGVAAKAVAASQFRFFSLVVSVFQDLS